MKKKTSLQKMSRSISLLLLLAALPFAVVTLDKKISGQRKIASDGSSSVTTQDYDLSEATPEEFKKAFKYQILKDAQVVQTPQGPVLRLGLFLMKNAQGNKVFVCEEYPTVDLVFSAEGVAFSGEIPQMVVRASCVVGEGQTYIEGAILPLKQIQQSPLSQYEFNTTINGSREEAKIFFRNVVEFHPEEWAWTGVKFYGKNPESTLQINGYEIISVLGEPLILKTNE